MGVVQVRREVWLDESKNRFLTFCFPSAKKKNNNNNSGIFQIMLWGNLNNSRFLIFAIFTCFHSDHFQRFLLLGQLFFNCGALSSAVNNIVDYSSSQDSEFADYHDIMENEFDKLLKRKHKNDTFRFYNGYKWNGRQILNIWSVMNFL